MDIRTTDDLDGDTLRFRFRIRSVTLREPGRYRLRLSVQNQPYNDLHGVLAANNENSRFAETSVLNTDDFESTETNGCCIPGVNLFDFIFPKGFCKNDGDHEVLLLIEILKERAAVKPSHRPEEPSPPPQGATRLRVGEARLAIYPREDRPPINLDAPVDEDMYVVTDEVVLQQVNRSSGELVLHPGTMKFVAALRKIADGSIPTEMQPSEQIDFTPRAEVADIGDGDEQEDNRKDERPEDVNEEEGEEEEDKLSLREEETVKQNDDVRTPTPTEPSRHQAVVKGFDCPLPNEDLPTTRIHVSRHVAAPTCEELHVIIHGAVNVPKLDDGQPPTAFCSVKTKSDEERDIRANVATDITRQPTCSPDWQHFGIVEVDEKNVAHEVLLFKIIDFNTNSLIICYRLPISFLRQFHQYHLEMIMPTSSSVDGVRLTVSITRKASRLPIDRAVTSFFGLEVLLKKFNEPLPRPEGPVTAVLRITGGYYPYKEGDVLSGWTTKAITVTSVVFPNPAASAFNLPKQSLDGNPQITLPGQPEEQPEWKQAFMFGDRRDTATMFGPQSALIIEFYLYRAALSTISRQMVDPLGFCVLELTPSVYQQLMSSTTKCLQVDSLPLQTPIGTKTKNEPCSVSLILRLVMSENPDAIAEVDDLPRLILDQKPIEKVDEDRPITAESAKKPPFLKPSKTRSPSPPRNENLTGDRQPYYDTYVNWRSYRRLVDSLEEQIKTLTRNVRQLERGNATLRDDLRQSLELMNTPPQLMATTTSRRNQQPQQQQHRRTNLAQKYADDYSKLMQQTAELRQYSKKAFELEQELSKKAETQTHLHYAVEQKRDLYDRTQVMRQKVARLEKACRDQEKEIERLEKLLNTNNAAIFNKRTNATLREENRLLRIQLQTLLEEKRQQKDGRHLPSISRTEV